ncbi:hypothetical protein, partial [Faecalibacterium sp.]|uniref:hypothetical protein n=1 Tax=Faecalibacterium sp. TaxID=1971605 RepID=UPI004025299D
SRRAFWNTIFEKISKKFEKCIPNRGCGFLFIEGLLLIGLRHTVKDRSFSVLEQDSPMVTQNSLS